MGESIHDLYSLVAQERLRNDASSQDPSAKLGVFVDRFFDDDMRDQGMDQTAAIVDGEMTLPIAADIAETGLESDAFTLSYELESVPAKVTLNLAVDRWTEVNTSWSSPITRRSPVHQSADAHQHCWKWQPLSCVVAYDQQCVAAPAPLRI